MQFCKTNEDCDKAPLLCEPKPGFNFLYKLDWKWTISSQKQLFFQLDTEEKPERKPH